MSQRSRVFVTVGVVLTMVLLTVLVAFSAASIASLVFDR